MGISASPGSGNASRVKSVSTGAGDSTGVGIADQTALPKTKTTAGKLPPFPPVGACIGGVASESSIVDQRDVSLCSDDDGHHQPSTRGIGITITSAISRVGDSKQSPESEEEEEVHNINLSAIISGATSGDSAVVLPGSLKLHPESTGSVKG